MRRFAGVSVIVSLGLLVLVSWSGSVASAAPRGDAASGALPIWHVTASSSVNWAGYVVKAASKSVTDVKGSWIVPKVVGSCPSKFEAASFWVGIDGFGSSSVEQTGTDSDCFGGAATYYAWYEFYPHPSHTITSLTVSPGDTISAEVSFTSGKFTTHLTDITTGHSASFSSTTKAQRSSAEWIAEAPYSGGILPLTDFGSVAFGYDNTSVAKTCDATISGTTGTMGSFSGLTSITMVNKAGTANKAVPSGVSSDRTSFGVTWKSSGP